ncbi:MAG: hypothetical protein IJQ82_11410 [Selenomonadaceae bacterium]|nr:hypothetical protein [Selenomonadaceae bacterium]
MNAVDSWAGSLPGNVGKYKHFQAPPLIYTQTVGNTPFRLSLYMGDVGHTLIIEPTGAGKDARIFIFDSCTL